MTAPANVSEYDWIICMSGGKDSDALGIWARFEAGPARSKRYIHTETGHDHPITIAHLSYVEEKLGVQIERICGPYTWISLAEEKQRFPSAKARFCTEELKVKPLRTWIDGQAGPKGAIQNPLVIQGIRADESKDRAKLPEWQSELHEFASGRLINAYDCPIWRPLLRWSAADCFKLAKKYGIDPNPLYKLGMNRVGCWPCIMVRKGELAAAFRQDPDLLPRLREYEARVAKASSRGSATIFAPNMTPPRFHDRESVNEDGERVTFASIEGVYAWCMDPDQAELDFGPEPTCFSQYGLCE